MTAFDDGRQCPSLESFLEVTVEDLEVKFENGGAGSIFDKERGALGCRLRMLGNAMSRPPLDLGLLESDYSAVGTLKVGIGVGQNEREMWGWDQSFPHDMDQTSQSLVHTTPDRPMSPVPSVHAQECEGLMWDKRQPGRRCQAVHVSCRQGPADHSARR